jgi:hypothetical protein
MPGADAASPAGTGGGPPAGATGAQVGAAGSVGNTAGAGAAGATAPGDLYPLTLVPGKRYLVDHAGRPFMIFGDSPWECVTMLSNADVAAYFDDRQSKGFNTLLLEFVERTAAYPGGVPTVDGQLPFTKTLPGSTIPDFSALNDAYFAHVDEVVQLAVARGFLVLFTPAYLGYQGNAEGWYQPMLANGIDRLTAFGNYVGKRYAKFDNIMWVAGGDYSPPDKTLTRAVQNGIKAFDTRHLHTAHAGDGTSALDWWAGESWLDVDTVYDDIAVTHVPIYTPASKEYTRADHKPFFLIESCYEASDCGDEVLIRQQAYESLLTGAFGQVYSRSLLWEFPSNWKSLMQSQGSFDMKRVHDLFAPRRWDLLLPDVDGSFLTAGAGTGATHASAAYASDGSFAIAYTPEVRDLTMNMSRLARPVTAQWYDPTNGAFGPAGAALPNSGSHTFHPSGPNSRGKGDWVLLLEAR